MRTPSGAAAPPWRRRDRAPPARRRSRARPCAPRARCAGSRRGRGTFRRRPRVRSLLASRLAALPRTSPPRSRRSPAGRARGRACSGGCRDPRSRGRARERAAARAERVARSLEVLANQREEHAVDPLAMPPVRLALHSLADEAGALGVTNRPVVEAVALELEAVEAEIEQQVALEEPGRVVGEPAAAEVAVDRQPAEARNPASPVRERELHHPGARPTVPV